MTIIFFNTASAIQQPLSARRPSVRVPVQISADGGRIFNLEKFFKDFSDNSGTTGFQISQQSG
jgi:hypothetical protein